MAAEHDPCVRKGTEVLPQVCGDNPGESVQAGSTGCHQHGYHQDDRSDWSTHAWYLHPSCGFDGSWIGCDRTIRSTWFPSGPC